MDSVDVQVRLAKIQELGILLFLSVFVLLVFGIMDIAACLFLFVRETKEET